MTMRGVNKKMVRTPDLKLLNPNTFLSYRPL